ncbi:MAG: hypothetical protein R3C59_25990 [Planctomycetaceae bacterium]
MNDTNPLPQISMADCQPVPVFNCHVILSPSDADGRRTGRVANLAGITATGVTERDLLTSVMKQFKAVIQQYIREEKPIPFVDPPETPRVGEVERFIPVHL